MPETWRPVVGREGFYEVSDLGRVRSVDRWFVRSDGRNQWRRGRLLTPCPCGPKRNYFQVEVRFGLKRKVHQLVCEAFHGPRPSPSHVVAHWDGDPSNNRADNLRWATAQENRDDSQRLGEYAACITSGSGVENPNARLTWEQADRIRELSAAGYSQSQLTAEFSVSKGTIHNVLHGIRWRPENRPDPAWEVGA